MMPLKFFNRIFICILILVSLETQAVRPELEADKVVHRDHLVSIYSFATISSGPGSSAYRPYYTGLPVGTFLLGQADTPLKYSQKKVDLFSGTDAKAVALMPTEIEAARVINYSRNISPYLYASLVSVINKDKYSSGHVGNLSTVFAFEKDNLYLAWHQDREVKTDFAGKQDLDISRLVGQYRLDRVELGLLWQRSVNGDESFFYDAESWLISSKIHLGALAIKGQLNKIAERFGEEATQWALGFDYALAAGSKLYAYYSSNEDVDALSTRHKDAYGERLLKVGISRSF